MPGKKLETLCLTDKQKTTKIWMIAAMGGKCQCCGYNKCVDALEFHHLDSSKKTLTFGKTTISQLNWDKVCHELTNCVLVCSNCHRGIEANALNVPKRVAKFNEKYRDYHMIDKPVPIQKFEYTRYLEKAWHDKKTKCVKCDSTFFKRKKYQQYCSDNCSKSSLQRNVQASKVIGGSKYNFVEFKRNNT